MAESSPLIAQLRALVADGGRCQAAPVAADAWVHEGLERGRLHDVVAHEAADAAAAAGFAVALALAAGAMPVLWLRTDAAERREGRVHASGLAGLGLAPADLLLGVVADEAALLRTAADAARCAGLGTLLIEIEGQRSGARAPGLDLTATRRLMLAAEASGVTVLALRIGGVLTPSAAMSRWAVGAVPSSALAADAPGLPAFDIICERRRGHPGGQHWRMEWDRDTTAFRTVAGGAALSGAGFPLAADRAIARAAPSPVRRSG